MIEDEDEFFEQVPKEEPKKEEGITIYTHNATYNAPEFIPEFFLEKINIKAKPRRIKYRWETK